MPKKAPARVAADRLKLQDKKRKTKRKQRLKKGTTHWFELKAAFDPTDGVVVPGGEGFMRGALEDFVVVSVGPEVSQAVIAAMGAQLNEIGVKVMVVRNGVEFLRLRVCDEAQEKKLDKILKANDEAAKNEQDNSGVPASAPTDGAVR